MPPLTCEEYVLESRLWTRLWRGGSPARPRCTLSPGRGWSEAPSGGSTRACSRDDGATVTAIGALSFYAYATLQYGANVVAGDLQADSLDDVVTGPGPGPSFGAQVRGFAFDTGRVQPLAGSVFAAFPTMHGVIVSCGELDDDSPLEVAAAPGAGPSNVTTARGFDMRVPGVSALPGCEVTTSTTPTYGGRVAVGDLDLDGLGELVVAPGPSASAAAVVERREYDPYAGTMAPTSGWPVAPFGSAAMYGSNVVALPSDL